MARRILLWGFRPVEDVLHGLGTLERQALDIVWRLGPARVRDVRTALDHTPAYTTVMTVLDRLYKKGVLDRERTGRAYVYSATASPDQLQSSLAMGLLRRLLGRGREAASPVLSSLVDAVGDRDRQLLDDLDRLIREKRRQLDPEGPLMFVIFGLAMALTTFLLANALVSLAVAAVAPPIIRRLAADRLRLRARVLLGLRLLPASAATAVAAGLVVPAYILFEPANAGERVTVPLALLASAALAILVRGATRGAVALAATGRLVRAWQRGAEPVDLPGCPVPAYRVRDAFPAFSVVGWRHPRMFVSARVLDALTPAEVAAAVAHERAHLGAADNLKRLLMRFAPDLLVLSRASRALEAEWARAAEAIADERASGGDRDRALALAAGLIKVARLVPASAGRLPVSALHDGGDVESRVRRLVAAEGRPAEGGTGDTMAAVIGAATVAAGLVCAVHGLPTVHALIEVAARLLR